MGIHAANGVQYDGRVGYVTGDRPDLIQRRCKRNTAVTGHTAVGRFNANHAVERSRLADGSAGIGTQGPDGFAGRNCRRAATGGTAGNAVQIPCVMGLFHIRGFRSGTHGEFVHVGLAQENGFIFTQISDNMSVIHRDKIIQNMRRAGSAQSFGTDVVFDGARNAGQRFDSFAGGDHGVHFGCLGQRVFFVQRHIGADFVLHFLDAVIYRFGQLYRAELFILQLFMQLMNGAFV